MHARPGCRQLDAAGCLTKRSNSRASSAVQQALDSLSRNELAACVDASSCVAGAQTADGHYINTEDTDCEQCKADLYLYSVVSRSQPGRACCPEHAGLLEQPLTLLYRCP